MEVGFQSPLWELLTIRLLFFCFDARVGLIVRVYNIICHLQGQWGPQSLTALFWGLQAEKLGTLLYNNYFWRDILCLYWITIVERLEKRDRGMKQRSQVELESETLLFVKGS